MIINFVTGNKNKYDEVVKLLPDYQINQINIDLVEIQGTPNEIIDAKIQDAINKGIKTPFLVEDTSLYFDALNGLPGPYIKHFCKSIGSRGLYNLLSNHNIKTAKACCYVGYYDGKKQYKSHGSIKGTIVEPRGDNTFSWDNIFVPNNYSNTFAELGDEKIMISHRAKSIEKIKPFL
ncbi:Ham1 family inosine/xanthosine triphosphate pyrophosphatase [Hokovirus HKV1]|uniref:Ham1 family inosine/xanthosine triphosphate pyrophosphatase n=1 Tax=Hokovirus HKV1 TaxID=1977638 RepID=A0A1V0SHD8_9VIRU|nr:Ham1 family inosine/xanthosine triphosphate pyrophosphatase [Hokovirus HKV1]